jgi:hypothetical protein
VSGHPLCGRSQAIRIGILLATTLTIGCATAATSRGVSWVGTDGSFSATEPVWLSLNEKSRLEFDVTSMPAKWLVPNLYVPITDPLALDCCTLAGRHGHDAHVLVRVTSSSGRSLLSFDRVLQERWGWGGTFGKKELRWHKPIVVEASDLPVRVLVAVTRPSSSPASFRFELDSTNFAISDLPHNKALHLTGLRLPEIW